jgi:hypothetical protein
MSQPDRSLFVKLRFNLVRGPVELFSWRDDESHRRSRGQNRVLRWPTYLQDQILRWLSVSKREKFPAILSDRLIHDHRMALGSPRQTWVRQQIKFYFAARRKKRQFA